MKTREKITALVAVVAILITASLQITSASFSPWLGGGKMKGNYQRQGEKRDLEVTDELLEKIVEKHKEKEEMKKEMETAIANQDCEKIKEILESKPKFGKGRRGKRKEELKEKEFTAEVCQEFIEHHNERQANKAKMDAAIEAEDYDKLKELVEEKGFGPGKSFGRKRMKEREANSENEAREISQEFLEKIVEKHKSQEAIKAEMDAAIEAEDYDKLKELVEKNGFGPGKPFGRKGGMRRHGKGHRGGGDHPCPCRDKVSPENLD